MICELKEKGLVGACKSSIWMDSVSYTVLTPVFG